MGGHKQEQLLISKQIIKQQQGNTQICGDQKKEHKQDISGILMHSMLL